MERHAKRRSIPSRWRRQNRAVPMRSRIALKHARKSRDASPAKWAKAPRLPSARPGRSLLDTIGRAGIWFGRTGENREQPVNFWVNARSTERSPSQQRAGAVYEIRLAPSKSTGPSRPFHCESSLGLKRSHKYGSGHLRGSTRGRARQTCRSVIQPPVLEHSFGRRTKEA
jgi:hypothetical protein